LGDFGAEKINFSEVIKKHFLPDWSQGLAIILSPVAENNHRRHRQYEVTL